MFSNGSAFLEKPVFYWAFLAHLGYNMWADPVRDKWGVKGIPQTLTEVCAEDHLRFDLDLWHEETKALAAAGCNLLVLDVGEGMQYESHPEISCRGALPKDVLQEEIFNLKMMGITVVPKLNFSACHDEWMGEYGRMLSTTPYYRFCEDVITEVCEVFGHPKLFHLGMDEENLANQRLYNMVCIRQGELWWHDLNFYAKTVMRCGARPWIWSDYMWDNEEEFLSRMSRDILQSNWYYGSFEAPGDYTKKRIEAFFALDRAGFEQIPTGSVWSIPDNLEQMVKALAPLGNKSGGNLRGFMQSVWRPMMLQHRDAQDKGISGLSAAKKQWNS